MMVSESLSVLLRLFIAHLLTDFVLQPSSWVKDRSERKLKSPKLYLHGLVTAAVAYILSGLWAIWWLPLFIGITHVLIDLWKSYRPNKAIYFIIDQLLHLAAILLAWITIFDHWHYAGEVIYDVFTDSRILIIVTGYITAAWPLGIFIGIATEKWRRQAEVNSEGLAKAGMSIGLLERFLIVTFILINQFTAVGLLIAAKSILRFSDKENTQKKTEYVLIGTLLSFSVSFIIGLLMKHSLAW